MMAVDGAVGGREEVVVVMVAISVSNSWESGTVWVETGSVEVQV